MVTVVGGGFLSMVVTRNVEAWSRDSFTLRRALARAVRFGNATLHTPCPCTFLMMICLGCLRRCLLVGVACLRGLLLSSFRLAWPSKKLKLYAS